MSDSESNSEEFDIKTFIKNNPIDTLNENYNNKLIQKINKYYDEEHKQMFIMSFYQYLNYKENDYVVKLDSTWEWLGYSRIEECKRKLIKYFKENEDYKIKSYKEEFFSKEHSEAKKENNKNLKEYSLDKGEIFAPLIGGAKKENNIAAPPMSGAAICSKHSSATIDSKYSETKNMKNLSPPIGGDKKEKRGIQNKQYIKLTVACFKELCIVANTEKAKKIRKYYLKLEEILNELIAEQSDEFRTKYKIIEDKYLKEYSDYEKNLIC